jgi:dTDP-4-amino-4,6-dideoxygalactose transaminase
LQLNELGELRNEAYECAASYKAKMKEVHDVKIRMKTFTVGQKVWLYNSRVKFFPGKLKSKWIGPYVITAIRKLGVIEIEDPKTQYKQVVNGHRLKPYMDFNNINEEQTEVVNFVVDVPDYGEF